MNIDLSVDEIKTLKSLKYSKNELILTILSFIILFIISDILLEYNQSKASMALKVGSFVGFMILIVRIQLDKRFRSIIEKIS